MKSDVKNDFVKPIAILTLICLFASAILAATNSVTLPIIQATEASIAEAARAEVLPAADGFTEISDQVDLSGSCVTAVYEANNGAGYVFMITGNGYGGKNTMKLICSIDKDGNIVQSKTLAHAETAGLGSKTTEDFFRNQFSGKGADYLDSGFQAISGASFSSNYYKESLRSAFAVYDQLAK